MTSLRCFGRGTDRSGEAVTIDAGYMQKNIGELAKNTDLSRFIL